MTRRVVVTGMGTVCPVGNSVATSWDALTNGRSGIAVQPDLVEGRWQGQGSAVHIAGRVKDFDPTDFVPIKEVKKSDDFIHFAIGAAQDLQ